MKKDASNERWPDNNEDLKNAKNQLGSLRSHVKNSQIQTLDIDSDYQIVENSIQSKVFLHKKKKGRIIKNKRWNEISEKLERSNKELLEDKLSPTSEIAQKFNEIADSEEIQQKIQVIDDNKGLGRRERNKEKLNLYLKEVLNPIIEKEIERLEKEKEKKREKVNKNASKKIEIAPGKTYESLSSDKKEFFQKAKKDALEKRGFNDDSSLLVDLEKKDRNRKEGEPSKKQEVYEDIYREINEKTGLNIDVEQAAQQTIENTEEHVDDLSEIEARQEIYASEEFKESLIQKAQANDWRLEEGDVEDAFMETAEEVLSENDVAFLKERIEKRKEEEEFGKFENEIDELEERDKIEEEIQEAQQIQEDLDSEDYIVTEDIKKAINTIPALANSPEFLQDIILNPEESTLYQSPAGTLVDLGEEIDARILIPTDKRPKIIFDAGTPDEYIVPMENLKNIEAVIDTENAIGFIDDLGMMEFFESSSDRAILEFTHFMVSDLGDPDNIHKMYKNKEFFNPKKYALYARELIRTAIGQNYFKGYCQHHCVRRG